MATAAMNYDFGLTTPAVREAENGDLVISGLASNFDVDRVGDRVTRRALDRALTRYMQNPVVLWQHDYKQPAGVVTAARVDAGGLWIEARLPKPEPGTLSAQYWRLVKLGVMRALSIGGVWKRELVNGIKTLTEIDLREISIAAVGVNASTLLSSQTAKAFGDHDPAEAFAFARAEMVVLAARAERDATALAEMRAMLRA